MIRVSEISVRVLVFQSVFGFQFHVIKLDFVNSGL